MKTKWMKHILSAFLVISLVFVGPALLARSSEIPVPADRPETMYEPLFGIEFRLSEVLFERAPNIIYNCRDLITPYRELFLFGKVAKGKVLFYYVYGLIEVDWGAPPQDVKQLVTESDDGIIVVISPNKCRYTGAGYALSPNKQERQMARKIGITDDVLSKLISDAVDREVRAFGGKSEFLRRLAASGIDETKLPAQVRNKLVVIRKDEGGKPLKPITQK
jgi:hypothetical protein